MKRTAILVSIVLAIFSSFVPAASAQQPPIWVGQAIDADGLTLQAYGSVTNIVDGNANNVGYLTTDSYGNLYMIPYSADERVADGKYDMFVAATDYLMTPVSFKIRNGNAELRNYQIVLKPAMRDTSLSVDYNPWTREIQWSFLVRGRVAYSPILRIETRISSPGKTVEYTQFSVRQGQDFFGGAVDSYENTIALESMKDLSRDEKEAWHPQDAGIEAPKPQGISYYSEYGNYIKLPKSLPAGRSVCGFITVYRTGDPTNVRSNRHGFCVRLEPANFTGTPTISVW